MRTSFGVFVMLVLGLMPVSGRAQGFDCRKARSADEIAICANSDLARLDERLSALYVAARSRAAPGPRRDLEADQADWLASRRICGADFRCIRASYLVRIAELQSY